MRDIYAGVERILVCLSQQVVGGWHKVKLDERGANPAPKKAFPLGKWDPSHNSSKPWAALYSMPLTVNGLVIGFLICRIFVGWTRAHLVEAMLDLPGVYRCSQGGLSV
jgi:hypothetical protein